MAERCVKSGAKKFCCDFIRVDESAPRTCQKLAERFKRGNSAQYKAASLKNDKRGRLPVNSVQETHRS